MAVTGCDTGSALLLFAISLIIYKVILPLKRRRDQSLKVSHGVKSPKTDWLFGHIKKFPPTEQGLLRSAARSVEFPWMSMMWFGPTEVALECYHPDTVQPVLANNIPKATFAYKFLRPWMGNSLLLSSGEDWKRKRRLLAPAFKSKVLEMYVPVFNKTVDIMLNEWKNSEVLLEIYEPVNLMTLDAVLRCCMSREMNPQNRNRETMEFVEAIRSLNDLIIGRIMRFYLWNDTFFRQSNMGKKFYQACNIVHNESEKIIKRKRYLVSQKNNNELSENNFTDFLDLLLEAKDGNGQGLTDTEIRHEVDTFLFAGHDTTSSAISWTLYNLAKHPLYQENCWKELQDRITDKNVFSWSELRDLKYLNNCINESLRLYPPVTGVGRCPMSPMELRSRDNKITKNVPENSNINVRIFDLHRHAGIWKNPKEFDPDRFLPENVAARPSYSFIPFSAGQRNCIGQKFAMALIAVAVGRTILRYQLYMDQETPPSVMKPGIVLGSENGVFVMIRERDGKNF